MIWNLLDARHKTTKNEARAGFYTLPSGEQQVGVGVAFESHETAKRLVIHRPPAAMSPGPQQQLSTGES